jgi:hypothetical protein
LPLQSGDAERLRAGQLAGAAVVSNWALAPGKGGVIEYAVIQGEDAMANIDEILRSAFEANASDIHISVGLPPMFRLSGR